jgi:NitT/TauT family transport system substrate-binding protein
MSELKVYGVHRVMENATVHMAVNSMSGGKNKVHNGGAAYLVGTDASMNPAAGVKTAQARDHGGVTETPQALADIAMNADTQLLRYSWKRPDMRVLFNVTRGYYEIIARKSHGITKPSDLKGKKIGTFPRTSAAYFLAKELEAYGMKEEDVTIVPLAPELAISQALIDNELDAVAIWEPAAQHAKEGITDDAIIFHRKESYFLPLGCNTTLAAISDPEKRKQIVTFIQHLIRASKQMKEDPNEGIDFLVKASGFDRGLVARCLDPALDFCAQIEPNQLDVLVEQEVWVAKEQNRAPRSREQLATLIDTSVYNEAVAGMK